jgi:hypothetical protein
VSGVERVQDDDLGSSRFGGGEEVIQSLRCAEQMAGGASVDQETKIGGAAHGSPHDRQAADKLRDGKFELADQDTARSGDGKPGAVRAGRQREGEVGNQ